MKKITFNLGFYFLLLTVSLIAFSGCKDDDEEINKADYIGSYAVTEVCDGDNYSYTISITDVSGSDDEVIITNLWDWEEDMSATISDDRITIPSQVADDVTFVGSGELSGNTIVINYTASDASDSETCIATAVKQ